MTPEQRERISELVEEALGREPGQREIFLYEACDDEEIRAEVRSLVAEHERAGDFLEHPLVGPLFPKPSQTSTSSYAMLTESALQEISKRYEILGEIGRGGMGIVFRARDRQTSEVVAVKLLKPEIAADHDAMERFKNEMRLARKVTHKNVCRIYEFNPVDSSAYISMEFVDGESLRQVINRFSGLPLRKASQIACQVCAGLREAHSQGTVHRDLKPENIMIDAKGNAKIMDFGIARSVETGLTQGTRVIGTPSYMAPEQAEGKNVDGRTDIYALGLVLYEVLTGRPTFTGDTPVSIALKQISEAPVSPREVDPTIPAPVEAAILRCLAKKPEDRFQTVEELESKLDTITVSREGSSSVSAPTSRIVTGHRIRLSVRLAFLLPAILACLVVGFLLGKWKPSPTKMHHRSTVNAIDFSPDGKFLASASEDKTVKIWDLHTDKEVRTWREPNSVLSAVISPDGQSLAFASGDTVKLWQWKTESPPIAIGRHTDLVNSVAFSPDGHLMASGGDDRIVRLWETDTHKERFPGGLSGHSSAVQVVAFSPNGKLLASGSQDKTAKLWDVTTGREVPFPAKHSDTVETLAFSLPDGRWLASGSADGTIKLWEVETGQESPILPGHDEWVRSLSFSPDGSILASGGDDDKVKLWDVGASTLLRTFSFDEGGVWTVKFSPNGRTIGLGTYSGSIEFRSVN
jgi:serine/threonine protein kinase